MGTSMKPSVAELRGQQTWWQEAIQGSSDSCFPISTLSSVSVGVNWLILGGFNIRCNKKL